MGIVYSNSESKVHESGLYERGLTCCRGELAIGGLADSHVIRTQTSPYVVGQTVEYGMLRKRRPVNCKS